MISSPGSIIEHSSLRIWWVGFDWYQSLSVCHPSNLRIHPSLPCSNWIQGVVGLGGNPVAWNSELTRGDCYTFSVWSLPGEGKSVYHSVVFDFSWPMDCGPPGSSVCGILQARILEWVSIHFSRRSFQTRDWTKVLFTAGRFFTVWATGKPMLCMVRVKPTWFHNKVFSFCFYNIIMLCLGGY